jgi:hypothetical protein
VEEYWEPLLVLPSEQQQVAGREPPSERRSEGQPEYLGESLLHLHRHRAPITATRPTGTATLLMDIPPIGTLLTGIRVTGSRAMVTPDIRDIPLIPIPQAMDTQAAQDIPPTPVLRVMDTQATRDTPLILVLQTTDTQARRDTPLILDPQAIDIPVRLIPATRHLGTRAARHPPRIPVPVTDTPCTATPAIEPRRTGHLGPLLYRAFWLRFDPNARLGSSERANARLCDLRLRFLRRFKNTLPVQEPGRIAVIVDVPDRPEIREIQDCILRKIRHVVDEPLGS